MDKAQNIHHPVIWSAWAIRVSDSVCTKALLHSGHPYTSNNNGKLVCNSHRALNKTQEYPLLHKVQHKSPGLGTSFDTILMQTSPETRNIIRQVRYFPTLSVDLCPFTPPPPSSPKKPQGKNKRKSMKKICMLNMSHYICYCPSRDNYANHLLTSYNSP